MLVASTEAPSSPAPQLVRINARPILDGELGEPLFVGDIPMMVVSSKRATVQK